MLVVNDAMLCLIWNNNYGAHRVRPVIKQLANAFDSRKIEEAKQTRSEADNVASLDNFSQNEGTVQAEKH